MRSYDQDALWVKAKLFINRVMDREPDRMFEERALWASFALELLGKAALARINPCLIALPTDDGKSLMVAAGASRDETKLKTIPAKAVFARCSVAFPPFNRHKADQIAANRNEYVHGPESGFYRIPENEWWPTFWAQVDILVTALDRTLEDLVGDDRVTLVEAQLNKNKDNVKTRVEALIKRALQRLQLIHEGSISQRVAAEIFGAKTIYLQEFDGFADCPACKDQANVSGDHIEDIDTVMIDEEDGYGYGTEYLTVQVDNLACGHCGLVLEGPEYVEASDAETSFEVERDYEPEWEEYNNE